MKKNSYNLTSVHKKNLYTDTPVGKKSLQTDTTSHKESLYDLTPIKEVYSKLPDGRQFLITYYNLDMILAIGYRVKSSKAIAFRRWASSVLSQYIRKGYAINENRLKETEGAIIQIINNQRSLDERMNKLERDYFERPFMEKAFDQGQYFDAYEFFCSLVNDAKKSVCIIDPYFDTKGLRIVEKINKDNIDVTIIISKQAGLNEHDIELFEKQYFPVRVFVNNDIHDRFIVMDNEVIYSNGTSFNYMGRKLFHVSRVTTDRLKTSILNIVNDTITK